MSNMPIKKVTERELRIIIKRMEEPRPSITLGKADISVVLPILKSQIGE